MNIEDLKELQNRAGAVIMEFLVDSPPYFKGAKAGITPKEALRLWENGSALFASRPNIKPTVLASKGLKNPSLASSVPVVKASIEPSKQKAEPDGDVEIPENWESLHHLKRTHLAARIKGVDFKEVGGDDKAKEIIRGELARRAAKAA